MGNRQNIRDWLALSVSVSVIGVGLIAPFFLLPCTIISIGVNTWVLRKVKGLPRRSELVALAHREKWRQGLEEEFTERSGQLLLTVQQRDELVKSKALQLQAEQDKLIQWEKLLVEAEGRLTKALRDQEQYYIELIDRIEESASAEIQLRENAILQLQQKVMGLTNRPDPKQGFAAWIAQVLLQGLERNEIFVELKGFYKPPGIREVSVWLRLQPGVPAKKLENISKEVGTWVNFGEPTILWDADECVYEFQFSPQVESYETSYEVLIDNESELPEIQEPEDKNWFINVVLDSKSVHYMVHGPTGSGKSVLIDNIMCVAGDELATRTGKEIEIFIVDPKFPDSTWTYKGKRVKPQYRRWEQSIEGVLAMQAEVNDRLDIAAEVAEAVPEHLFEDPNYILPLPERNIQIWAIDEAAALHSMYKDQCSLAYKAVQWVGRSTLVVSILIGQNCNPSNYGLQIPDLLNCTRFYIGITALEALDRFIKPPREIRAKIKGQIYARLRIVKQKKLAGIAEPPEQFFALVVKANEPPFVAQLPPPCAYTTISNVNVVLGNKEVDITELVEQSRVESLEEHLREVVIYASKKKTWITGSELRQNKNRFKAIKTQVINSWFKDLSSKGFGECDGQSKPIKYCYPRKPEIIEGKES